MRLFTAIDIPEDVRANLHSLLVRLKPLAKIQWSPLANLHITTKFIGEWPEPRLDEIKRALDEVPALFAIARAGSPQSSAASNLQTASDPQAASNSPVPASSQAPSNAFSFDISVRGLGWFPNERRPRVFWAGVDGGESLRDLARITGQHVAKLGVLVEDRDFSPHLTLARIRESIPLSALQDAVRRESADFGTFRATAFFLYLSAGGTYTRLAEMSLS